ncbi:MAG: iron ABC transporter permease [Candidatus Margulisbacteria bacterium]|nr:iron ABC transporter permease [Candidatus Margulisiibacteriota bacterium]
MKKKWLIWLTLFLLFGLAVYLALVLGSIRYSEEKAVLWYSIVWKIRFPRMILAILTGAALSLGGIVYQALLKNNLAEPYLLGVSSGAALGTVIFILLGISLIPAGAFLGAIGAFFLIITLAKLSGKISSFSLVLSGVVINAFFAALISLMISLFPRKTFGILFWLMGNLEVYELKILYIFIFLFVLISLIILAFHRQLDLLALGEEEAFYLGVDVQKIRLSLFLLSTLLVAVAVSLTGIIGFVGLIVPHLARLLVGAKHLRLIPVALFIGAFFMLIGNVLIYGVLKNPDLPIGVFTALLGVPFLFYIFLRKKGV